MQLDDNLAWLPLPGCAGEQPVPMHACPLNVCLAFPARVLQSFHSRCPCTNQSSAVQQQDLLHHNGVPETAHLVRTYLAQLHLTCGSAATALSHLHTALPGPCSPEPTQEVQRHKSCTYLPLAALPLYTAIEHMISCRGVFNMAEHASQHRQIQWHCYGACRQAGTSSKFVIQHLPSHPVWQQAT
jgi:hypothetical protein